MTKSEDIACIVATVCVRHLTFNCDVVSSNALLCQLDDAWHDHGHRVLAARHHHGQVRDAGTIMVKYVTLSTRCKALLYQGETMSKKRIRASDSTEGFSPS